ncbi:hypothetical protein [Candidatus Enterococcus mansonii]|uniref:Uncharacterized protein n=1 Tax=Candidatus Enterococcus mansonii TaxID=1834181 RepID=A0A242CJ19_9ENTE|nr:hypothetical protein [Enterococcus sp. 4G2_DIV0659]OTO09900.1 hypothetical protein A5880_000583 [Enterococcus sp. 4G2_DIV0659]
MLILGIILCFFLIAMIVKNRKKPFNDVPQIKKPTKTLSLDEKLKIEKDETIEQLITTITKIEKQSIHQLTTSLNNLKEENTKL